MTARPIEVRVGQVWQDWDVRYRESGSYQRFGTVIEVDETHCRLRWDTRGTHAFSSGHTSRVKLSRMKPTSTGYRLVKDVPEATR